MEARLSRSLLPIYRQPISPEWDTLLLTIWVRTCSQIIIRLANLLSNRIDSSRINHNHTTFFVDSFKCNVTHVGSLIIVITGNLDQNWTGNWHTDVGSVVSRFNGSWNLDALADAAAGTSARKCRRGFVVWANFLIVGEVSLGFNIAEVFREMHKVAEI